MPAPIVSISDHAYERGRERLSLSRESITRLATKAFTDGITHADAKGNLEKYFTKLWAEHRKGNNIRIYGEIVYVFAGSVLITLFQLPSSLHKLAKVCKKQKVTESSGS